MFVRMYVCMLCLYVFYALEHILLCANVNGLALQEGCMYVCERIGERFDGGIGERINGGIGERINGGIGERIDGGIGKRIDVCMLYVLCVYVCCYVCYFQ